MLGHRGLRWLKGAHLVLAGLCLGGTAGILAVQAMKYRLGDLIDHLTAELLLRTIWIWTVEVPFIGLVITGLLFSLLSHWGFARHYWVTAKWLLAAGLVALNWGWLGPAVGGMTALADGGFAVTGAGDLYGSLFRQATGAATILVLALGTMVFVSVLKPWGRWKRAFKVRPRTVRVAVVLVLVAVVSLAAANAVVLRRFRTMTISHVEAAGLADGTYRGEASDGTFTYVVEVTVLEGMIVSVRAVENRDNLYARLAEGVLPRAVGMQSPAVEAITGATTTSKVLLKAMENDLRSAGG
ncbi:MAG: FMN-binding protein [bacterium]|nr:MAG: FMN-binding protein [bacterium]